MVDRYRVETVLSSGSFGRIYRARHVVLDRLVALKVLRPERSTEEDLQRFLREARIAAACSSEHVVQIYDGGRMSDGSPFLAMELLEGLDLGTAISVRGRLSVDESVAITGQVLTGLDAVHARGVVHRDLKPPNIFLSPRQGQMPMVKLLDFGISKFLRRMTLPALTDTGIAVGTPLYMAPEQLYDSREVDPRADLFCCGAILFKMLSGLAPREAQRASGSAATFDRPAPSLVSVASDVPPLLAEVVDKSLANDPSARFQSAALMWSAIERASRGIPASRPSLPTVSVLGAQAATQPNLPADSRSVSATSVATRAISSVRPAGHRTDAVSPLAVPRAFGARWWLVGAGLCLLLCAAGAVVITMTDEGISADLQHRLDDANVNLRAGRSTEARRGFDDIVAMSQRAGVLAGSPEARIVAQARIGLGNLHAAQVRPLLPGATTAEDIERAGDAHAEAMEQYGRVSTYGHSDLSQCAMVRMGRSWETFADLVASLETPAAVAMAYQGAASGYLNGARQSYETAIAVSANGACRTLAIGALEQLRRKLDQGR